MNSAFDSAHVTFHSMCLWEIANRVFRTAHELAMHTVAIYSYEDRLSAHRQKVRDVTPSGLVERQPR